MTRLLPWNESPYFPNTVREGCRQLGKGDNRAGDGVIQGVVLTLWYSSSTVMISVVYLFCNCS